MHCKFLIETNRKLFSSDPKVTDRGFLFVQIEQYGFDEDVIVMVQPHRMFVDHKNNSATNSSTKIYKSRYGNVFFIPAENDVLVTFEPIRNLPDNDIG